MHVGVLYALGSILDDHVHCFALSPVLVEHGSHVLKHGVSRHPVLSVLEVQVLGVARRLNQPLQVLRLGVGGGHVVLYDHLNHIHFVHNIEHLEYNIERHLDVQALVLLDAYSNLVVLVLVGYISLERGLIRVAVL